jgi:hypothetical protein
MIRFLGKLPPDWKNSLCKNYRKFLDSIVFLGAFRKRKTTFRASTCFAVSEPRCCRLRFATAFWRKETGAKRAKPFASLAQNLETDSPKKSQAKEIAFSFR